MRETAVEVVGSLRRRMVSGSTVTALGAALLLGSLFGGVENGILLVGIGAMATSWACPS